MNPLGYLNIFIIEIEHRAAMPPHVPIIILFKNLVRQFQGLLLYQHNL